jgi:hypothetical protein
VGEEKCRAFFKELVNNYPNTKIFAITPIWRKDWEKTKKFGRFSDMENLIKETVKGYPDVYLIDGFDLVPHSEDYFGDLSLHPNDAGFDHYYKNLYTKIKELI